MPVKAGPGGKEGLYCFGSARMQLASLLWAARASGPCTWAPAPPAAGLEEESLRLGHREGVRKAGAGGRGGGRGCAISVLAGSRVQIRGCPAPPSIPSHVLTTRFPPSFLFFFLKCKKLSAALERGSLDRPLNAKGAADGA